MKDRYGEEYAKKSFIDVWEYNSKKMKNAFYLTHLEYADKLSDNDAANIYSGYAMTTQYELMPHLLLKAQELVGGEEEFIAALRSIRNKYRGQQLFYDDFLKEMKLKKEDLTID